MAGQWVEDYSQAVGECVALEMPEDRGCRFGLSWLGGCRSQITKEERHEGELQEPGAQGPHEDSASYHARFPSHPSRAVLCTWPTGRNRTSRGPHAVTT